MREEGATRAARPGVWLAAALTVAALAHAPSLAGGFVWDDRVLVLESPAVVELRPLGAYFFEPFFSGSPQGERVPYYRPLATLSLALDHALGGGLPFPFHLSNLLAHAACTALVWALARRAGAGARGAAFAAALFATLPRGSEAVDWISGRTDLLAALGALAGLALHDPAPGAHARRRGAALAVGLGALAKETALAGAVAIAALEALRVRETREPRALAANLAPLALATAACFALRAAAGVHLADSAADPIGERLLSALAALGTYAWMLLDPLRPSLQIGLAGAIEAHRVAAGALALAAVGLSAALALRARAPALPLAAAALALAALLPVLHLVPIPLRTLAADRFLYLPAAGLAVVLAALAARAPTLVGRASARVVGAALLGACFATTAMRAATFGDEVALFEDTLARAHPANALPRALLGEALLRAGQPAAAIPLLEESLRIDAEWSRVRPAAAMGESILGNLAGCQTALGRHSEAADTLRELVARSPEQPKHHYNLAVVLARLGLVDAALAELDRALELLPGYPQAAAARRALLARTAYSSSVAPSASESFSRR
jgi:tetratricopeptide (TPR) repeat protein